jgi:hypothetical protein
MLGIAPNGAVRVDVGVGDVGVTEAGAGAVGILESHAATRTTKAKEQQGA